MSVGIASCSSKHQPVNPLAVQALSLANSCKPRSLTDLEQFSKRHVLAPLVGDKPELQGWPIAGRGGAGGQFGGQYRDRRRRGGEKMPAIRMWILAGHLHSFRQAGAGLPRETHAQDRDGISKPLFLGSASSALATSA